MYMYIVCATEYYWNSLCPVYCLLYLQCYVYLPHGIGIVLF